MQFYIVMLYTPRLKTPLSKIKGLIGIKFKNGAADISYDKGQVREAYSLLFRITQTKQK